jgi:hypothetical protein
MEATLTPALSPPRERVSERGKERRWRWGVSSGWSWAARVSMAGEASVAVTA